MCVLRVFIQSLPSIRTGGVKKLREESKKHLDKPSRFNAYEIDDQSLLAKWITGHINRVKEAFDQVVDISRDRLEAPNEIRILSRDDYTRYSALFDFTEKRISPDQKPVVVWLDMTRPYLTQKHLDLNNIRIEKSEKLNKKSNAFDLLLSATDSKEGRQVFQDFFDDGYGKCTAVFVDGRVAEVVPIGSGYYSKLESLYKSSAVKTASWEVGEKEKAQMYRKFLRSEKLEIPLDLLRLDSVDASVTPVQRDNLVQAAILSVIAVLMLMNLLFGRYAYFYVLYVY